METRAWQKRAAVRKRPRFEEKAAMRYKHSDASACQHSQCQTLSEVMAAGCPVDDTLRWAARFGVAQQIRLRERHMGERQCNFSVAPPALTVNLWEYARS